MSDVPTLGTLLEAIKDSTMRSIRVCAPARIESYDATTQSCSVQPLIYDGELDEDGVRQVARLPVITNVPVMHLGGNGFQITVPVAVGDTVLILFTDRSLDRWLSRGGEVDPGTDQTHHMSDAIAIPGLRDFAHALSTAPTDRIRIGYGSAAAKIDITATEIQAGGTAALALKSDLDTFRTVFNAHIHSGVTTGPGSSAISTTLLSAPTGTSVLKGG